MTDLTDEDVTWLARAEHELWDDTTRFDVGRMDALWAPGFHEVGRSGRRWTREELLAAEPGPIGGSLHDLVVERVTADVALVRYVSEQWPDGPGAGDGRPAERTSLWRRTSDGDPPWELVFHQGTPAAT